MREKGVGLVEEGLVDGWRGEGGRLVPSAVLQLHRIQVLLELPFELVHLFLHDIQLDQLVFLVGLVCLHLA